MSRWSIASVTLSALVLSGGCTVHPPGEADERRAAADAGMQFDEQEAPAALPARPTPEDLIRRALTASGEIRQRYWEWRAAIEQVPQDGTQPTNLALSAGLSVMHGRTSADRATIGAGNDPMADIVLPPKLSAAARRALEDARAAGSRFRQAQFDLRAKVLSAYADYALTAEMVRLEQANAQLLQTTALVVEAKNRAGAAGQHDLLKARTELDLSRNDIAAMQAQLPAQRAALNALLGRPADAPLPPPTTMPTTRPARLNYEQILTTATAQNPQLAALTHELKARRHGLTLAQLQRLPDFSLSGGTDLAGGVQSLAGMVTVPLLRHEAIAAAVAQAEANLWAAEAMRKQSADDLAARIIGDLQTIRDSDRQLELFERIVLPRARRMVELARSSYEAGQSTLLELLDAQRSLLSVERLVANVRAMREKRLAELEAAVALRLGGG
jgi:outer membrane protein, heavy metal efflux system